MLSHVEAKVRGGAGMLLGYQLCQEDDDRAPLQVLAPAPPEQLNQTTYQE
jgi:hypothetical protein